LALVIVYSVYTAVVFVSAYNFIGRVGTKGRTPEPRQPAR
jgi:hypothetical protein